MAGRENIYYWKCDRPSAFFAIDDKNLTAPDKIERGVRELMTEYFGDSDFGLGPAGGQGNHLTFLATRAGNRYFVRIENGPEGDEYMEVEAAVINKVREIGVPTPLIYAVDSSRRKYPFAWQVMENIEHPDLNRLYKAGKLDSIAVMKELGTCVARWQQISPDGFGPYDTGILRSEGRLQGLLPTYRDYYTLNLERHAGFLVEHNFIDDAFARDILDAIDARSEYLNIPRGCLVHKDLALWNVLGTESSIEAVIDWDDAVSGDPTDDISLMACFHSGAELRALIEGYRSIKPLPADFEIRFWLHLIRNMLFKAVIRVGAGYFNKGNNFFLVNSSSDENGTLHDITINRLRSACEGLKGGKNIYEL